MMAGMSRPVRQLLLWETEVRPAGDNQSVVVARRVVLEGDITAARRALGGLDVVSRDDVYKLRDLGFIKARRNFPALPRKDGKRSNAKWVFDLVSCAKHKERMEKDGQSPGVLETNCELFGNHGSHGSSRNL